MSAQLRSASSVVVGGGIGGLAAAAALREHGPVVLVEKDQLDRQAAYAPRRGAPQGAQLHNLLSCAQRCLERLLPGFRSALEGAGAGVGRVGEDTRVFELGAEMPRRDLGMRLMCAPRPTIERVARERLLARGGVRIIDRSRALGFELSSTGAVAGVVVAGNGEARSIQAPVVVDATGSPAGAARWLRAADRPTPPMRASAVGRWYVSAEVECAASPEDVGFLLVFPTPPHASGGMASPSSPGRWHVSLSGRFGQRPPRSHGEMRDYAATLEAPWILDLLESARPLSTPHLYRKPRAVWRHYERLSNPVPGLLPIGEAIASLNPLFGQGMSVAARQAASLANLLEGGRARRDIAGLTREYLAKAAEVVRGAWTLGHLVEPGSDGQRGPLGSPGAARALGATLHEEAELHRRYVRMWHLLEPVSALEPVLNDRPRSTV